MQYASVGRKCLKVWHYHGQNVGLYGKYSGNIYNNVELEGSMELQKMQLTEQL